MWTRVEINTPWSTLEKPQHWEKGTFLRVTYTLHNIHIFDFGSERENVLIGSWRIESPTALLWRFIAFSLDVGWLSFEQEAAYTSSCIRLLCGQSLMVCSITLLPVTLTLGWFISKTNFLFDHNSQFKGLKNKFWSKQQQDRISAPRNLFIFFGSRSCLFSCSSVPLWMCLTIGSLFLLLSPQVGLLFSQVVNDGWFGWGVQGTVDGWSNSETKQPERDWTRCVVGLPRISIWAAMQCTHR